MTLNFALFIFISLTIPMLLLIRKARAAYRAMLEKSKEVDEVAKAYEAVTGYRVQKLLELNKRYKGFEGLHNIARFIVVSSVLASTIVALYWLLVSGRDEVLMASLLLPSIAASAIIFRDAVIMRTASSVTRELNGVIEDMKNGICKRVEEVMAAKVRTVVMDSGGHGKAPTKELRKLESLLVLMIPRDALYPMKRMEGGQEVSCLPALGFLRDDPELHANVVKCIEQHVDGLFIGRIKGKDVAVAVRKLDIKMASFVTTFVEGQVYMKMVVRPVEYGKKYAENVFRDREGEVYDVVSWLERNYEGATFIIFLPLKGTTGWSIATKAIELLTGRTIMVVLVHEPPSDIRAILTHDINDRHFKVEKTVKVLAGVMARSPVFIFYNQPTDAFDRDTTSNFLGILDACSIGSSGTTDMPKLLARAEISPLQYVSYHSKRKEEMLEEDYEKVAWLAEVARPEAVMVCKSPDYPSWVPRTMVNVSADVSGFIVSYGLYGIKDEVLRRSLEQAYNDVLSAAWRKFGGVEDLEKLKSLLEEGLRRGDGELKRAALLLASLEGRPPKELYKAPPEVQRLQGTNKAFEVFKQTFEGLLK